MTMRSEAEIRATAERYLLLAELHATDETSSQDALLVAACTASGSVLLWALGDISKQELLDLFTQARERIVARMQGSIP
jgi:hypothetical protein